MTDSRTLRQYIRTLQSNLSRGNSTEHTHRPVLKNLLESLETDIIATNEPRRIECGAPDFAIANNGLIIGYIETKDCGTNLDAIHHDSVLECPHTQNGKQLRRYRKALSNLILTNYTEFRWYVDDELRLNVTLAENDGAARLTLVNDSIPRMAGLLEGFLHRDPEPVSNPRQLAQRMARLAHMIRDIVIEALTNGKASDNVKGLYEATEHALVPNLGIEEFADMLAQTLAYGLFAARVNDESDDFHWSTAAHSIPAANPFLGQVFYEMAGLNARNEPFIGFVEELTQVLAISDMSTVLADFGSQEALQDPIMHFYQDFLEAYDPELREQRGVYYTPEPVISYIVQSVDHLLRRYFNCPEGLADHQMTEYETLESVDGKDQPVTEPVHRVLVLDPACGTGSFLYNIISHVREYYRKNNNAGLWSTYVQEHLLPRIFGFEVMMAPYAMAHLKLGLQLAARDLQEDERAIWDYSFNDGERFHVYLTNTLEQTETQLERRFAIMRTIADEVDSALKIKRDLPIMVVIGNPPYSGHSANSSLTSDNKFTWIGQLIEDYKYVDGNPLGERNSKWVQDDYVKFIRFGQYRIQQSGGGILAFITNNSYIDSPTLRGMRQQLMSTFDDVYLLDLHGNAKRRERSPDGSPDQNVFDIMAGVAIAIFVKRTEEDLPTNIYSSDLYGSREAKYEFLSTHDVSTTEWEQIDPQTPYYVFKKWDNDLSEIYDRWWKITDIMTVRTPGIVTGQDNISIQWSAEEMRRVAGESLERISDELIRPILYRPFDIRHTYYSPSMITRRRQKVMQHFHAGQNIGLITCRQQSRQNDIWQLCGVTDTMIESSVVSNATREINSLFPLYSYPPQQGLEAGDGREANISPVFIQHAQDLLGLDFISDGEGDLCTTFGPEDILHYIYAIFHAPEYRQRYAQFLHIDYPRIPFTHDLKLFSTLVGLGRSLKDVHLLHALPPDSDIEYPIGGTNTVERTYPKYYAPGEIVPNEDTPIERGRVYINSNNPGAGLEGQYFEGVSPDVWVSRVGKYQPMDKWLKDREGRTLHFTDIIHYKHIGFSLSETLRLTAEVEEKTTEVGLF